ncbi:ribosome-associated translation inhibitor RaiA [Candidatus Parcubacteria bacterium]|nr:ribosome-associated translation inhibitor RaiA [Candidatus Parcubacteria bacterium]
MKINIKATNFKLTPSINEYIGIKIGSLEKFIKASPWEVWVEVGKTTHHHHKGQVFRAEVQLKLPGKGLRVESIKDDIHLAIDEVKDELQRKLKQYQEKQITETKKGARIFKEELHLSE